MAFEQRDMTGTLFRNESTNVKAPSHKGKVVIGGVEYPIAAWVKEGAKGRFFSIKVEEPKDAPAPGAQRTRTPGEYPEPARNKGGPRKPVETDEIPF